MRVSIPFDQRVFRDFRLFVVAALIENQGRSLYLPVIIDSGASYLTVRPDVFEQLGVAPIRETPLVTASERAVAPLGRVDRVTVGDRCLAVNVEMISIPLPEDLPAEGLLGASFLRHFLVSMDYEKGKLVFTTR
ncbi:MAG: clan AA aspartic protease [Deltaproteobacteria bacterium]|nr:clan AA aspartic protease [Deltaproteobacteria bacterium]